MTTGRLLSAPLIWTTAASIITLNARPICGGTDCIPQIQDDFEKTQGKCREVTLDLLPSRATQAPAAGLYCKAAAPLL